MAVPKTKIRVLPLHHDIQEPAVDVAILEAIHMCDMKITSHPRAIRRRWMKQPPERGLECLPTRIKSHKLPCLKNCTFCTLEVVHMARHIHMASINK